MGTEKQVVNFHFIFFQVKYVQIFRSGQFAKKLIKTKLLVFLLLYLFSSDMERLIIKYF